MNLEEMKRIAEARSKGPWQYSCCYGVATIECEKNKPIAHAVEYIKTRDADFICLAANTYDRLLAVAEAAKVAMKKDDGPLEKGWVERDARIIWQLQLALKSLEQE